MTCCLTVQVSSPVLHAAPVPQDIPGVDDAANFAEVLQALADIGLDYNSAIKPLLSTLSGLLWLGNLSIEAGASDDSSKVVADVALNNAAALLGVQEGQLTQAITHKKVRCAAWVEHVEV